MCWVVTARTAFVAIAASAALPPRCSICTPGLRGEVVDGADHAVLGESGGERTGSH